MWFADIYCDSEWVAQRNGVLGAPAMILRGVTSQSLGIDIELLLYGDVHHVRHMRVLMHTDDQHAADRCIDMNTRIWVTALEAMVMLETQRPFHVEHFWPSRSPFGVVMGNGAENAPASIIKRHHTEPTAINYRRLAIGGGFRAERAGGEG